MIRGGFFYVLGVTHGSGYSFQSFYKWKGFTLLSLTQLRYGGIRAHRLHVMLHVMLYDRL